MKEISSTILDKLWLRFSITTGILLVIDQASKFKAVSSLNLGDRVDFGWQLVYNDGIVFGIDLPTWIIFLFSMAILGMGTYLAIQEKLWQDKWHLTSLSMILAGALGNLIDRVRLGYVVDFIKIYWWPNFNLSDVWILSGVFLMGYLIARQDEDSI